jgi:hypothetical protein
MAMMSWSLLSTLAKVVQATPEELIPTVWMMTDKEMDIPTEAERKMRAFVERRNSGGNRGHIYRREDLKLII